MADLLAKSVGNMFLAALFSGTDAFGSVPPFGSSPSLHSSSRLGAVVARDRGDDLSALETLAMISQSLLPPTALILLTARLDSLRMGDSHRSRGSRSGGSGAARLSQSQGAPDARNRSSGRGRPSARRRPRASLRDSIRRLPQRARLLGAGERENQRNAFRHLHRSDPRSGYMFRSLGGDDLVIGFVERMGLGPWGLLLLIMAMTFSARILLRLDRDYPDCIARLLPHHRSHGTSETTSIDSKLSTGSQFSWR